MNKTVSLYCLRKWFLPKWWNASLVKSKSTAAFAVSKEKKTRACGFSSEGLGWWIKTFSWYSLFSYPSCVLFCCSSIIDNTVLAGMVWADGWLVMIKYCLNVMRSHTFSVMASKNTWARTFCEYSGLSKSCRHQALWHKIVHFTLLLAPPNSNPALTSSYF